MKFNQLLTIAAIFCVNGVLSTPFPVKAEAQDPAPANDTIIFGDQFYRCEKAPNCEVYIDERFGKSIRFKKGMEPGTASYNETIAKHQHLSARAQQLVGVGVGDNRINYGSSQQPHDVIWVLWDFCKQFNCGNSYIYKNTQRVANTVAAGYWGTEAHWYSMIVHAEASYSGYDQRDKMIKSILALSRLGVTSQWVNWKTYQYNGQNSYVSGSGSLQEYTQSDYYQITMYQGGIGSPMLADMKVWIGSDFSQPSRGGCDLILSVLGQVAGLISPIIGITAEGIKNAFC
ncbi:hypothetical protein TWF718_003539 [Orbilia javanica]|uniref:Secreted protein n=1 Tax=Orbilia javanica TaxID=47235 RepID=A0AAN8MGM6_9PEZI